ncbi:uncharacterized protein N7473_006597 [Penicillium subrubescens]|uniref:uncharacterized protein n=1 Tax=Penicillium subrubescens TaxID=1316194 RepID=UPI002544DE10|nr:uncharacterized protein N7473_006597 [Penicillium subrubescens]KAJ5890369.1 hypothetical protein N7473_006597 [Penicillium subrubescens]
MVQLHVATEQQVDYTVGQAFQLPKASVTSHAASPEKRKKNEKKKKKSPRSGKQKLHGKQDTEKVDGLPKETHHNARMGGEVTDPGPIPPAGS